MPSSSIVCTYVDALNPSATQWQGTVNVVQASSGGEGGSWIVGAEGTVMHPSRDGRTWVTEPAPTENDLLALYCVQSKGWAVGVGGTLLRTIGGAYWSPGQSGTNETLRTVAFADHLNGVAAGDAGTVLRSDDGGAYWTVAALEDGVTATIRASDMSHDGSRIWVAGDAGTLQW